MQDAIAFTVSLHLAAGLKTVTQAGLALMGRIRVRAFQPAADGRTQGPRARFAQVDMPVSRIPQLQVGTVVVARDIDVELLTRVLELSIRATMPIIIGDDFQPLQQIADVDLLVGIQSVAPVIVQLERIGGARAVFGDRQGQRTVYGPIRPLQGIGIAAFAVRLKDLALHSKTEMLRLRRVFLPLHGHAAGFCRGIVVIDGIPGIICEICISIVDQVTGIDADGMRAGIHQGKVIAALDGKGHFLCRPGTMLVLYIDGEGIALLLAFGKIVGLLVEFVTVGAVSIDDELAVFPFGHIVHEGLVPGI